MRYNGSCHCKSVKFSIETNLDKVCIVLYLFDTSESVWKGNCNAFFMIFSNSAMESSVNIRSGSLCVSVQLRFQHCEIELLEIFF